MRSKVENILLLVIVIGTIVFFSALMFIMSDSFKRQHELKMKCTEHEASNTPICLKAAYNY